MVPSPEPRGAFTQEKAKTKVKSGLAVIIIVAVA
jgi:hypothetical protein